MSIFEWECTSIRGVKDVYSYGSRDWKDVVVMDTFLFFYFQNENNSLNSSYLCVHSLCRACNERDRGNFQRFNYFLIERKVNEIKKKKTNYHLTISLLLFVF